MSDNNKFSCLHTHTNFCDGRADVETFCRAAFEKGLCALGFSGHAPIAAKTGFGQTSWNMKQEDLEKYCDTVRAARERWKGRLDIYLGLEVDFIPGLMGPSDRDYREMGLDYIIGSVHYVIPPKGAPFTVDAPLAETEQGIKNCGGSLAVVEKYFNSLNAMINSGGFDILGHPDLVRKHNSQNRFFDEGSPSYLEKCRAAAETAGKCGITIEVNTGGMNRGYISSPYPSLPFLEMFRKNNVPAIINADAHKPDDLDGNYTEAVKSMLMAGYSEMALPNGGKNGAPIWRFEKLHPVK